MTQPRLQDRQSSRGWRGCCSRWFVVVEAWTTRPTEPCDTEFFETREAAERAALEYRRASAGGLIYRVEGPR